MSAPAALMIAKIMHPEDGTPETAGQLVLGPREHALDPVQIVAGGKVVLGDECDSFHPASDSRMAFQLDHRTISPATAAATQSSMDASAGV